MKLSSRLFRAANRLLAPCDLRLARGDSDFEYRPLGYALDRMCLDFAACFEGWRGFQSAWPLAPVGDLPSVVRMFYEAYLESGFRRNPGGSRFNNLLWLHLLARSFRPSTIIDSGTFTGASAWALSSGAPAAEVLSFDLDMSRVIHRRPGVRYLAHDWVNTDFAPYDLSRALCYFDDHVDQAQRALQAHALGIGYLIFDDDFPCTSFPAMAHGGSALPKISFAIDQRLEGIDELAWSWSNRTWRWKVDRATLSRVRGIIAAHERLPETSLITGVHQTPYRILRLVAPSSTSRRGTAQISPD
jgi:hypothetical protein